MYATGLRHIPNLCLNKPSNGGANVKAFYKIQPILRQILQPLMKILLRKVTIADSNSTHNNLVKDILIVDGITQKIDAEINTTADYIFEQHDCFISPGWVDVFSHFL